MPELGGSDRSIMSGGTESCKSRCIWRAIRVWQVRTALGASNLAGNAGRVSVMGMPGFPRLAALTVLAGSENWEVWISLTSLLGLAGQY